DHIETFVYAISGSDVLIDHNYAGRGRANVVTAVVDPNFGRTANFTIEGNKGFKAETDLALNTPKAQGRFSTWQIDSVPQQNYFPDDFQQWKAWNGGGRALRGDMSFQGRPTALLTNLTGANVLIGIRIDLGTAPELAGPFCYLGGWVQSP